ncbi:DegT/DnrJ/EryC1/StrS family aminotransferase, partial [Hamadaea sp. NPDC051192]|uniref:HesB/IscA family protein n=1 Tax=Hamadaea sp. NPDC051192 TaxID=3154940 RepID=UPI003413F54C
MTSPTTQSQETAATGILLTDVAAGKVKALLEQEGRDDLRLRVAVQPGGCSGLRYQLFFDERQLDLQPGDEVILPSFTFCSTANAYALRGAIPV